jgi:hypothetical protein
LILVNKDSEIIASDKEAAPAVLEHPEALAHKETLMAKRRELVHSRYLGRLLPPCGPPD